MPWRGERALYFSMISQHRPGVGCVGALPNRTQVAPFSSGPYVRYVCPVIHPQSAVHLPQRLARGRYCPALQHECRPRSTKMPKCQAASGAQLLVLSPRAFATGVGRQSHVRGGDKPMACSGKASLRPPIHVPWLKIEDIAASRGGANHVSSCCVQHALERHNTSESPQMQPYL